MPFPQSNYIPQINAVELPKTRRFHYQNVRVQSYSNMDNATAEIVILASDIQKALYFGLLNGGAVHPQDYTLHISSIDISYDYPKEYAGNVGSYYNDDCVKLTLNYKPWQMPNQGYESVLENISMVQTVPLRGLYWSLPLANAINPRDPVWGIEPDFHGRHTNLRITRTYTGRLSIPMWLHQYHNTLNAVGGTIAEWGFVVGPEELLFTVGNFSRTHSRDWSSNDPNATVDIYSYSYSMEYMAFTWNSLFHPFYGVPMRLFYPDGQRVSFYPRTDWLIDSILE